MRVAGEVDGRVPPGPTAEESRVGARGSFDEHLLDAADAHLVLLASGPLRDLDQALQAFDLHLVRHLVGHRRRLGPCARRVDEGECAVEAYLGDQKRILPVAAHLSGQYGVNDLYVGVPAVIGAGGVEEVIEIALDDEAKANFQTSVDAVKELLVACKGIDSSLG